MVIRVPTAGDGVSPNEGCKSGSGQRRVRSPHHRSVLFADDSFHFGRAPSYSKAENLRIVSVLAQILEPIAGNRAERAARTLLERFGTLHRTLSASEEQIADVLRNDLDIGEFISAARALVLASLSEAVERTPVDTDSHTFRSYLVTKFSSKSWEELHAIFVDSDAGFLSEDLIATGGVYQVETKMSGLLRRGLELRAAGYFLVHNHPSSSPNPSIADVRATKQCMSLSRAIGIKLIDHLIIAGNRVVSMKKLGLI